MSRSAASGPLPGSTAPAFVRCGTSTRRCSHPDVELPWHAGAPTLVPPAPRAPRNPLLLLTWPSPGAPSFSVRLSLAAAPPTHSFCQPGPGAGGRALAGSASPRQAPLHLLCPPTGGISGCLDTAVLLTCARSLTAFRVARTLSRRARPVGRAPRKLPAPAPGVGMGTCRGPPDHTKGYK